MYIHACSLECVAVAVLHVWSITVRWPVAALHVRIYMCMHVCVYMYVGMPHSLSLMHACVCVHVCARMHGSGCVWLCYVVINLFCKKKDFFMFSFCFPEQCCSFTLHWWYVSKKISIIFVFALSLPPEPVRLSDKLNLKETNFKRSGNEVRGGGKG